MALIYQSLADTMGKLHPGHRESHKTQDDTQHAQGVCNPGCSSSGGFKKCNHLSHMSISSKRNAFSFCPPADNLCFTQKLFFKKEKPPVRGEMKELKNLFLIKVQWCLHYRGSEVFTQGDGGGWLHPAVDESVFARVCSWCNTVKEKCLHRKRLGQWNDLLCLSAGWYRAIFRHRHSYRGLMEHFNLTLWSIVGSGRWENVSYEEVKVQLIKVSDLVT